MAEIRPMEPSEIEAAARLWQAAWRDAHLAICPPELTARRTFDDFARRLAGFGDGVRVAGPVGAPLGLCVVRADELHQMFVGAEARGTGLAQRLLADGEARIAAAGHGAAWLDCAIGNDRAARFYVKCGWHLRGEEEVELDTSAGPFRMKNWVFTKTLPRHCGG